MLADRLFGPGAPPIRYDTIGSTVFGTPELGAVGLTEREALDQFPKVDIYKTDFRPLRATVSGGPERTIMKLVVDGSTQRIVGAHILGSEAAEMIQLVAVAMTMGATKAGLRRDHRRASDRRRGTGDHALSPCALRGRHGDPISARAQVYAPE